MLSRLGKEICGRVRVVNGEKEILGDEFIATACADA